MQHREFTTGTIRSVTYVSGPDREETGAGEGIRTLGPNLGKVVLYLMNPLIFAGTHIGQISWTNDAD